MIEAKCSTGNQHGYAESCFYRIRKHRWEHIINKIFRQGGNARYNICPGCGEKTLKFNYDWEGLK